MTEVSTSELVHQARAGTDAAREALVRRFLRAAYAVALAVTRVPADAEDLAHDAMVYALGHLGECRHPERFGGWLVQMARSRALNRVAHEQVARRAVDQLMPSPELAAPVDVRLGLRRKLIEALALVTPIQREVVLLHDLEAWTHAEIAEALELSEAMSRQHLFHARRTMRAFLQADLAPTREVTVGN